MAAIASHEASPPYRWNPCRWQRIALGPIARLIALALIFGTLSLARLCAQQVPNAQTPAQPYAPTESIPPPSAAPQAPLPFGEMPTVRAADQPVMPDYPLKGPIYSESGPKIALPPVEFAPTDVPLPINLATAFRLSNGRPLIIAAAEARVMIAAAQAEHANALWLPNVAVGADYLQHTGGYQNATGNLSTANNDQFYTGGSLEVRFATTDAYFTPLAARQVLRSRRIDTQTARNEALAATAESYFTVQMARGTYLAMRDATAKSHDLVRRVESLAGGLVAPDEIDRARTLAAELEQVTELARQQWRVSSANLTRVLRLDPSAVVMPEEPDHMQVSLISPTWPVDDLVVLGLMNRPELAANRALVEANLIRLKRERVRPLLPSILITGVGTPDFYYQGSLYGVGSGGLDQWAGRSDISYQAVWKLDNLGFGYQAKVREQRGELELATVELANVQDTVAAQVAQAKADVDSATVRVKQAETGLQQSLSTYAGNLEGMGQTQRFSDILTLVNRPQEVVASLQQLQQAYANYFRTVADFNRSQFRLFYALGFPAEALACDDSVGKQQPVDTYRGPALPEIPQR